MGRKAAMRRLEALLKSLGAKVKVIYLPDGPKGEKTGLDDFFARGGTRAASSLARDLEPVEESNRKRREGKRPTNARPSKKKQSGGRGIH
jgi:hypothetical protein